MRRPALKNWQFVDYFTNEPKSQEFVDKAIENAKEFGNFLCEDLNIAIKGEPIGYGFEPGTINKLLALRASREEIIAITCDYQEIVAC